VDPKNIVGIIALFIAAMSLLTFLYFFLTSRNRNIARSSIHSGMMGTTRVSADLREKSKDVGDKDFDKIKRDTKRKARKKPQATLEELFFHAGMFSEKERKEFLRLRMLAPIVGAPLMAFIISYFGMGIDFILIGLVLGGLVGLQVPKSILQRKINGRAEDILFYLPLVIEQISIGVSSSLDIGPCIQRVVAMADERDSHNVVTELMRLVQFFVKSGSSLEHALSEVGKMSGNTELKHAFMALSQVAKHGGEISRQLQELADSVSSQRETKIEAKIKKLELEATGPVALVFCGFLIILLIGFGLQVLKAF
jgi:pilus assembly protein TadC